ncbi:ribosylnicotinamide kinase [Puccinia graminis f. sp. tritici]|uniref:Ribosylnicotinamide kinase n=2 Tax=Puccinia graminis f. sp. tritici TaxID=56615 RepID=E3JTS0_PUCGT|nr:uncharacterized protein PGTG_00818 [Puccinia graminis f. sp. tritici CRL 75-36-700-3]EFP75487.1 hypothetical protein PGTG_00818 [Puccinia graminis f. sp. tritici CRL 75-36-700-3]KAA1116238.1 ribosylnicotinamide kinase [Puccinia graminis f. sp. tritici]
MTTIKSHHPDVLIIAIGGPTCSGKTTLAKNLQKVLPNSEILHQDDFAPKSEEIPIHPVHGVPDWDDPRGAIDWSRLRKTIAQLKTNTNEALPMTHDNLNTAADPIDLDTHNYAGWVDRLKALKLPKRFIILDGFLLYWDRECVENYDLKFFVRESYDVLKERRRIRQTYHTADGMTWKDPAGYWDQIIWPAYLLAHSHMFKEGAVETAALDRDSWAGKDVVLLEPSKGDPGEKTISQFLETTLKAICDYLQD